MGLTLLAAGTSIPDTVASVMVAREGKLQYLWRPHIREYVSRWLVSMSCRVSLLTRQSWHGHVQHCGLKCLWHAVLGSALVHQDRFRGHQQSRGSEQHRTGFHFLHPPPLHRLPLCLGSHQWMEAGLEIRDRFPFLLHSFCHSVHPVWTGHHWK